MEREITGLRHIDRDSSAHQHTNGSLKPPPARGTKRAEEFQSPPWGDLGGKMGAEGKKSNA